MESKTYSEKWAFTQQTPRKPACLHVLWTKSPANPLGKARCD